MTITFYIAVEDGEYKKPLHNCDYTCPDCTDCLTHEMNLANLNARTLVEWLDMAEDGPGFGEILASELAARCRRRLWEEPRNYDLALDAETIAEELGVVIDERTTVSGRGAGYLRDKTETMLAIALLAGDKYICWS